LKLPNVFATFFEKSEIIPPKRAVMCHFYALQPRLRGTSAEIIVVATLQG
jgi:hypothetical protein